jgi:V8-like Glu-specific endopeptidase
VIKLFLSTLHFISAVSLISEKLVITAAHCIQDKNSDDTKKLEDSIFSLGQLSINLVERQQEKTKI